MKTLELLYQDTQIHFALQNEGDIMINATEMARAYKKRIDHFLKSDQTKAFIKELEFTPNGGNSEPISKENILQTRGHMGTYMHELLAIKFGAWLDPKFEIWIYKTIRDLLTKETKHVRNAADVLSEKESTLQTIISEVKVNGSQDAIDLLSALSEYENAKKGKTKAVALFSKQLKITFN